MKNVLFVVSTLKRSGPVSVVLNIIRYMDRSKFYPMVLTLSPEGEDSLAGSLNGEVGAPFYSLGLGRIEAIFKAKDVFHTFLVKHQVDVIHSHGLRPDWLAGSIDFPTVSTLHNYPFEDYKFNYGPFLGSLIAWAHVRLLRSIDKPYTVSKTISDTLRRDHGFEVGYVRNGVDSNRFLVKDKSSIRKSLGIPIDKTVFLYVGHLSDLKDPITVIKGFKEAGLKNGLLILLGDGPLRSACEKLVDSSSSVMLLGRVENVEDYFSASDCYISSSLTESFQLTVLEAVFSGVYCVLSDIPVRREMMSLGLDFKLFKPRDHVQLSNIIANTDWGCLDSSVGRNRVISEECLSARKMSENYQSIYASLT